MGFFSNLFSGKNEKQKESDAHSEYVQVIASQGQRLVDIMNESIHLANDSKNVDTKASRLGVAKDKLAELKEPHGIWLPQLASKFAFFSKGGSMWSPIGNVPEDGGDLLPYLIKVREIIEQPLSSPSKGVTEALTRVAKIKALVGGRAYKYDENYQLIENNDVIDYFPMVFVDDKRALDFILDEIGAPSRNGLTVKHILELHAKGYNSIVSMLEAPDDVLLSVSGIGKKKLEAIRKNLPAAER